MANGSESAPAAVCGTDCRLFLLGHDLPWHPNGAGELSSVAAGCGAIPAVRFDFAGVGAVEGMGVSGAAGTDSHVRFWLYAAGCR